MLLAFRVCGSVIVIHGSGDTFSDAVKPEHAIAESHGQQARQGLQFLKLRAGCLAAEAIGDPYGHLVTAPHLELRLVVFRREIIAARIDDAGQR
jgi:hypothetical protein